MNIFRSEPGVAGWRLKPAVGVYGRRMEIPAKMKADPRLRGDDENGCGEDMRLQSGGGFPLL